jgi:hypothetical protein
VCRTIARNLFGATADASAQYNQRPRNWPKSGNPRGKPSGTRGEAEGLTRKAIELALAGDVQCLRLRIDRVCPPPRGRAVTFPLPAVTDAASLWPPMSPC